MRIAQVAPLSESVPPQTYGGTERVVAYLTEELVRQGHDVTLFASGDSRTSAHLVEGWPRSLRRDEGCDDKVAPHLVMIERVMRACQDGFDVVHFHTGYLHFPLARHLGVPHVTTMHGRQDRPEAGALLREYRDVPLVSISDDQRTPAPEARWVRTVQHGLPDGLLAYSPRSRGYLAFLGRISPEKRPDRAVAIARAVGMPLRVAAKVDKVDREYYERDIRPLFESSGIEYIGEIAESEKSEFLGGADALLFPIDWPEPFGMVMIEAMACGTPVVAWNEGSVSEVIEDGRTGFLVRSLWEAIERTRQLGLLSRAACRESFERRFTAERMARNYVNVYERLIDRDDPLLLAREDVS